MKVKPVVVKQASEPDRFIVISDPLDARMNTEPPIRAFYAAMIRQEIQPRQPRFDTDPEK
ncbi:hypothetical protein KV697_01610 [Sphingomonas sanguinis]|nr:hypothetical protein [Sphingomonas sanguinis]QXT36102.1 hypothetical protein KV697_01610 [Sphingomonas sanguinis]